MEYNTEEVERIANRVSVLAGGLNAAENGDLKRTAAELSGKLSGKAAKEMQTALDELIRRIHFQTDQASLLAKVLRVYAAQLRKADEESRANIDRE